MSDGKFGTDVMVWGAPNSPGSPVCISGGEDGYSVNVYEGPEGGIIGVLVFEDVDLVAAVGLIPGGEVAELIEEFHVVPADALGTLIEETSRVSARF